MEETPTACPAFVLTLRSPAKDTLEMFIKAAGGKAITVPISLSLAKYLAAEAAAFVSKVDKS